MLTTMINKRLGKGPGKFGLLSVAYACVLLMPTRIRWVCQLESRVYITKISDLNTHILWHRTWGKGRGMGHKTNGLILPRRSQASPSTSCLGCPKHSHPCPILPQFHLYSHHQLRPSGSASIPYHSPSPSFNPVS